MSAVPKGVWTNRLTSCSGTVRRDLLICDDCQALTGGFRERVFNDMKYRGIEYSVVQGIGRHVWKWSVSLDTGVSVGGANCHQTRGCDRSRAGDWPRAHAEKPEI